MRLSEDDVRAAADFSAARRDMVSVLGPWSMPMLRPHNSAVWNPNLFARSGEMDMILGGLDNDSSIAGAFNLISEPDD